MIFEKWKQIDLSVPGVSHLKKNLECQDETNYCSKNEVRVVALADGAGSVQYSKIGAKETVSLICNLISEKFFKYIVLLEKNGIDFKIYQNNLSVIKKEIISSVNAVLGRKALELNTSIDQLASTLLFAASYEDIYLFGHLGDGVIGAYQSSLDIVNVISSPENGDRPNITFFTTDIDAEMHLRLEVKKDSHIDGIILMSDGPESVLYNPKIGFIESTKILFKNYKQKTKSQYKAILIKFMSENLAKYSEDDLSFNILYKEEIDVNSIDMDYLKYYFSDIKYKEQIIRVSNYGYLLEPLRVGQRQVDINNLKELEVVLDELDI